MGFILKLALSFLGDYWKQILIIATVITLFFTVKTYVFHKIELHDAAIVKETTETVNAAWQSKLDEANRKNTEALENVRKQNQNIKKSKPTSRPDVIKLLRQHRFNKLV